MPETPFEISVQETQRLLAGKGAGVRLIDVRDPDEYAYCRLPNAELIPLQELPAVTSERLPDKTADILVYCHHGMRSAHAAQYLRQMGYANARSVAGGIERWSTEVDPAVPKY